MKNITKKAKVDINWKVSPYDYSKSKINDIVEKASKKYNISKEQIKVKPDFIMVDSGGKKISIEKDIIENIQDPSFQQKLFKEFIETNKIDGCDFNSIKDIDNEINSEINYKEYSKYKRLSIKWIKWDNFLSYGPDNIFNFDNLQNLVLLNGEPANQSGKTTFAVDLIHFLLFGKTSKAETLDKIFNKHLKEATNVNVEGCIVIDNEEYIINRILTRPSASKRTEKSKVSQKVEYFKVIGGIKEELTDYDIDNQQGESTQTTNKIIKDAIGKESDFNLMMSITESTLDAMIDEKPTERGKLLSRWIGLLPLEEKEILARNKFNTIVKPSLMMNHYNVETVNEEINSYLNEIDSITKENESLNSNNSVLDAQIKECEDTNNTLLQSKQDIDSNLMKLDKTTVTREMNRCAEQGKNKNEELKSCNSEIEKIGDVEYSTDEYDKAVENVSNKEKEYYKLSEEYKRLRKLNEDLDKNQYCPTCKRKLDNVDYSKHIEENKKEMDKIAELGNNANKSLKDAKERLNNLKTHRDLYMEKNTLTARKAALELNVEKLRNLWKEDNNILKEYEKNSAAIDNNNRLQIAISNNNAKLVSLRNAKVNNVKKISENEAFSKNYNVEIERRKNIIEKLKGEEKTVKNWKVYLDIVGKNGISKMVLRKTLPIINARLVELLDGVSDFDVEVEINNKNEVAFNLIKDGILSNLNSGSGFERTASSLALRSVLSDISTIPKLNFIVLDELLGRVASENYESIHLLYDRMLKGYDFIIQITHLDEVKDWHDTIITVKKDKNISLLQVKGK